MIWSTNYVLTKLPILALEFATILVSVFAAFWLNSWRESRTEDKLAAFYLQELASNLASDELRLLEVINSQEQVRDRLAAMLDGMSDLQPRKKARLDSIHAQIMGSNPTFFLAVGAYRAMVAEGALKLISNNAFLTELVERYEFHYVRLNYLGTVLDDHLEQTT